MCLWFIFSRVQELEATLYPVSSVCVSVCPCVRVCVRVWVSIEWFSSINYKRVVRCSWYLYTCLISMRCFSWPKVKVMRSKVKVKYAIIEKYCFGYKSWSGDWMGMILIYMINIKWVVVFSEVESDSCVRQSLERDSISINVCVIVLYRNYKQMVRSWWYLRIRLRFKIQWSLFKVKVTRSKVKVKYAIAQKYCVGYKSWTDDKFLMILKHMIDINE